MGRKIKKFYLLFYFILSLFFLESILKIGTIGQDFFSLEIFVTFIFTIIGGLMFFIISSFFEGKINYIISSIFIALSGLIFSTQLIYFKFFRTFYSIYSAKNSPQIFEFWKDILSLAAQNFLWISLFFLPTIFIILFGQKALQFNRIRGLHRALFIGVIIITYFIGLSTIYAGGKDQYSPYDLYFETNFPNISVEKLGLITTMRLDLQRLISGWTPVIHAAPVFLPSPVLEPTDETLKELAKLEPNEPMKEKKIEYQKMDIDFEKLISSETNEKIKQMHQYFMSVPPTTKNDFTGKYKGYNLILITAESFSPYAVNMDVTPTLFKLVHDGYYFTNFYNPLWGVSTSDGEYVALTGLIPKSGIWSFRRSGKNYLPFVMGNQLRKLGYKTMAYHNHYYTYYGRDISHPNMGYEYKGLGNGLEVEEVWPESDLDMMEVTIPEYIDNQPFHTYYMTVSGHMQYSFTGNTMSFRNRDLVRDLPYTEQGKAYIAAQIELDKALELLLAKLEEKGVADKTLIALSADHYPYGLNDKAIDDLAGHAVEKNFELYKSDFILYTKGMEPTTIEKPCSSLDILPTLSNLLGIQYDSRLLMGTDIFSDSKPLVIFWNKSFITDKGSYNSITKEFIPTSSGKEVDVNYIQEISAIIDSKFYYSARILDTDYYSKVIPN